ncbi:PP2C family protein-serine/threonine phosphatase [Actinomadura atramentaria]|uniref:PP2C family protein-serine/threonine phosphatase n=1 Tax=Actinomadura atramentaria TaxID=1990 RepID=UPI0003A1EAC0|nr:protein phosphatase 2C domain-containing protein [Actinomadura atramentaria]
MTLGIRYAARSDVGMLREGNEDSAYAGSYLLAVADGMGGHVGGEIASAAAIEALRKLDTRLPAAELLAALENTVRTANDNLHRIVESDPSLQGMGTTLTAMLWADDQVALVHIGDSRAYLLRDGSLYQITHDHTLVQSLVDEGRISPDEAASHPQRSLLLRALDGRGEVDPDLSLREGRIGDRYLLCSDGLSGVVTAETIFQVLTDSAEPEQAVRQLIDLANRGGGPDNITCVVADVVELGQQQPRAAAGQAVGAAAAAAAPDLGGATPPPDTPASRAAQLRDTMPQPPVAVDDPPPAPAAPPPGVTMPDGIPQRPSRAGRGRAPRRWTWLIVMLGVVVVGIAAVGTFTVLNIRSGYFVGEDKGVVVLYRGTTQQFPGLWSKASEQPRPPIAVADLPQDRQQAVKSKYTVKGPAALEELRQAVCRHAIVDDGGKVVVVRGRKQQNCQEKKVQDGGIELADLPKGDADAVRGGKLQFTSGEEARAKLAELAKHRDECKSSSPSLKDCPGGGKS